MSSHPHRIDPTHTSVDPLSSFDASSAPINNCTDASSPANDQPIMGGAAGTGLSCSSSAPTAVQQAMTTANRRDNDTGSINTHIDQHGAQTSSSPDPHHGSPLARYGLVAEEAQSAGCSALRDKSAAHHASLLQPPRLEEEDTHPIRSNTGGAAGRNNTSRPSTQPPSGAAKTSHHVSSKTTVEPTQTHVLDGSDPLLRVNDGMAPLMMTAAGKEAQEGDTKKDRPSSTSSGTTSTAKKSNARIHATSRGSTDSNPLVVSAMETPLFDTGMADINTAQQPPNPHPHPPKSQTKHSDNKHHVERSHHSSSLLLDSSCSLLQPVGSSVTQKKHQEDLFKDLSTPSPIAQSSRLDFDSPSPQMVPRSEVRNRRKMEQQQQTDEKKGRGQVQDEVQGQANDPAEAQGKGTGSDGGGRGGTTGEEGNVEEAEVAAAMATSTRTPSAAAAAAGGAHAHAHATQSHHPADPLFDSPSPTMIPRSEMKKKKNRAQGYDSGKKEEEEEEEEDDDGPLHYSSDHHHHHRMMLRQASSDPLGGGGGNRKVLAKQIAQQVAPMPAPLPPSKPAMAHVKEKEKIASKPLHASNPALARALWSSEDDAAASSSSSRQLEATSSNHASGHTIPASGSARVERQRQSSLGGAEDGNGPATMPTMESDGNDSPSSLAGDQQPLCRTARWRIRLGLLQMPGAASVRNDAIADGGHGASTGRLNESSGRLNDETTAATCRRGKMQRSNSLGRIFGLGGPAEPTDEAAGSRSSFNKSWTSSDFAAREHSDSLHSAEPKPTQRPMPKRRNSLSRLLGISNDGEISDNDDDNPHADDDNDAGTEMQESQSSMMNDFDTSSDEEGPHPIPPVDTRPVICLPFAGSLDDVSMSQLIAQNMHMLEKQRVRYDGLAKRHYWSCKEIGSLHGTSDNGSNNGQPQTNEDEDEDVAIAAAAAVFDPLSALADEAELKKKREAEMDLEYRKEKARQHLGLPDKAEGQMKKMDSACGGSRFTEYYSSAEVLHVIEKDLIRLPPDHIARYHRRRLINLGLEDPGENLSYAHTYTSSGLGEDDNEEDVDEGTKLLRESRAERSKLLGEVLFVYAREHQALGYRQGMHEILSYLLLAMEIDLEETEKSARPAEEDDSTRLLQFDFLRNDLYCIFEALMGRVSPSYDTHSTKRLPTSHVKDPSLSPMEVMGESILAKVRDVAGDAILYRTVTSLDVPPQLFCTRWVRLIFAREVEGSDNVLQLWDAFIAIAAEEEAAKRADEFVADGSLDSAEDEDMWLVASLSFMDVLESAAASMILLVRDRLLAGQRGASSNGCNAAAMNDAMNTLMNYPPLKEATPLADLVRTLIWQQRREAKATALPIRKENNNFGSNDTPRRRNSLSRLFGLDGDGGGGGGIAHSVRGSMTKISDAIAVATTPSNFGPSANAVFDTNVGASTAPHKMHPPPRRRSQSSGALRMSSEPAPQAQAAAAERGMEAQYHDGRSNEELATSLGTSVATIMQHLKETTLNGNITVPHAVWEALLDINNVGKDLMARDGEYQ